MVVKSNIHIGQILIFKGIITPEQLSIALEKQRRTKELICSILIKLGFTTEEKVYPLLAERLGVDYIRLQDFDAQDKRVLELIPKKFAYYYKIMPLKLEGNCLTVATNDPLSNLLISDLRQLLGIEVSMVLASESDILEAIHKYYGDENQIAEPGGLKEKIEGIGDLSTDPLIMKVINQIFTVGIEEQAVGLHTEQLKDELRISFKRHGNSYEISIKKSKIT